MNKLAEIQQIASKITLRLDSPQSVKLQVKQIGLAQKQLKAIKKEINALIRDINQQATQSGTDSLVSIGLDVFGKHKWAGTVRSRTRRVIERDKKSARQPYMDLKDAIDEVILEGDQLKLIAEEYLINS